MSEEENKWGMPHTRIQRYAGGRAAVRRAWESRRRGITGWVAAFLALAFAVVFQYWSWTHKTGGEQVYVLDPHGNVYFGMLQDTSGRSELFNLLATDAATVFFQRSSSEGGSLDRDDLAQRLFQRKAYEWLRQDLEKQRPDLSRRKLHQKVEIGRIRKMEERQGSVFVLIEGQLIRAGHFNNHPLNEAVPFSLVLKFVRNTTLSPGSPPWVVAEWSRTLPEDY
jgi:hypothetical protein